MADQTKKPKVQIALTSEQKEQIKKETGREYAVLELDPQELEERVAPGSALLGRC